MAIAITAIITPASSQLVATQFGFPSIFQNSEATAFTRDTFYATNFEDVSINFGAIPFGFPSISQTSIQTVSATHTDFSHTEETAAFAYPFAGVGAAGIPGMGFW